MQKCVALLLLALCFSCEKPVPSQPVENAVNLATIDLPETSIALIGETQKIASTWESYTSFITGFENYDHSPKATTRLAKKAAEMRLNLPSEFDTQPVRSRILVLQTRLSQYASFLTYNNKTSDAHKKHYTQIINALDHLNGQLNEVIIYAAAEQALYDELKADLETLNDSVQAVTDSIP